MAGERLSQAAKKISVGQIAGGHDLSVVTFNRPSSASARLKSVPYRFRGSKFCLFRGRPNEAGFNKEVLHPNSPQLPQLNEV